MLPTLTIPTSALEDLVTSLHVLIKVLAVKELTNEEDAKFEL